MSINQAIVKFLIVAILFVYFIQYCDFKGNPWNDTILFYSVSSTFRFKKYFLSIYLRIQGKPKDTLCTPKGWLNASTALGHNYVDAVGPALDRQSVLHFNPHVLTIRHQLRAASFMWLIGDGG